MGTGAGNWISEQWGYPSYKKLTGIKNPGVRYVFQEEKADVGGWIPAPDQVEGRV